MTQDSSFVRPISTRLFLLDTYNVPITVIDAEDTIVIKTTKAFVFMEARGWDSEVAML